MRTILALAMAAILAFSVTPASAAKKKHQSQVTTGQAIGGKRGANSPRFCPPGQKKKPGKGSAFKC